MYSPVRLWGKRKRRYYDGYVIINIPEHPKSFNGWYYEHRLVVEAGLDRILEDWETVHHINENKQDNRLINLFVCTRAQHSKAHKN